eukprot:gene383-37_t
MESLNDTEFGLDGAPTPDATTTGGDVARKAPATKGLPGQQIVMQAFILTFLAEWGDRSQIATIALAAAQNPFGVTLGACIGHAICTGMAVIGGKLLASSITERQVNVSG